MQRRGVEVPGQAVNRRRDFASNGSLSIVFGVTGAGPSPPGRPLAALETDGVLVDVGHRGLNGLHGWEIPILPSVLLPESKTLGPGRLEDHQPFQERAPYGLPVFRESSGKRGLPRVPQQVHSEVVGRGRNEDGNVLRQEDRGDPPARWTADGRIETFRREMSPLVVRQEGNPPIARESQLVAVAGLGRSLDGLSLAAHGRCVSPGNRPQARTGGRRSSRQEHGSSTTSGTQK
jgi:hypothetical protein